MNGTSAVVGIGESTYYKAGGATESEFQLACIAIRNAVEDAGLELRDIDGFASFSMDRNDSIRLMTALGTGPLNFTAMAWPGGGNVGSMTLQYADAALTAGYANYIVCFRALAQGQFGRFGQARGTEPVRGQQAFLAPYGLASPAQQNAIASTRYMHQYRISQEALCDIALASYTHAQRNPRAIRYGRGITREDYHNSRWIAYPFHLYDCCQENDGAAAVVITTAERARRLNKKPAYIKAAAIGTGDRPGLEFTYNEPNFPYERRKYLASQLWARSGVGPQDVDVAQFYENFTGTTLMAISDMGFAPPEGIEEFVSNGDLLWPDGKLPMNTSGANLAEAYIHGFEIINEAVRQVRGESTCQVQNVELSLAVSGPGAPPGSAVLFSRDP